MDIPLERETVERWTTLKVELEGIFEEGRLEQYEEEEGDRGGNKSTPVQFGDEFLQFADVQFQAFVHHQVEQLHKESLLLLQ